MPSPMPIVGAAEVARARLVHDLLQVATRHDANSEIFVSALATVLAQTAASLDRFSVPMPLDLRLQTFDDEVRRQYAHVRR